MAPKIVNVSAPAREPDSIERTLLDRRADLQAQVARLPRAPERGSGISFGKRIAHGTCESCGTAIPAGRLEARPESTRCVECAAVHRAPGA